MYDALVGLAAQAAGAVRVTRDARANSAIHGGGRHVEIAGRDPSRRSSCPARSNPPGGEPASRNLRRYPRLCPANRAIARPAPSGSGAPQGISISRQRLAVAIGGDCLADIGQVPGRVSRSPRSARSTSTANRSISLDTVGSHATRPNTAGTFLMRKSHRTPDGSISPTESIFSRNWKLLLPKGKQ